MLNEQVLDALLSINVPMDKARAAAIAMAIYDPQLAAVKAELVVIKWTLRIIGALTVMNTALLFKLAGGW